MGLKKYRSLGLDLNQHLPGFLDNRDILSCGLSIRTFAKLYDPSISVDKSDGHVLPLNSDEDSPVRHQFINNIIIFYGVYKSGKAFALAKPRAGLEPAISNKLAFNLTLAHLTIMLPEHIT